MARTDTKRDFRDNTAYHIFNRGVNHGNIFLEKNDYWFFRRSIRKSRKKYGRDLTYYQFCLIPNHFHYVIHQKYKNIITQFMRSHLIRYARYIDRQYHYRGPLYEGRFKAIPLYTQRDIRKAIQYVADNPREANLPANWPHVGVNP
jgi:putative transposase